MNRNPSCPILSSLAAPEAACALCDAVWDIVSGGPQALFVLTPWDFNIL